MNTLGAQASAAWLEARGLASGRVPHWYVEVELRCEDPGTVVDINVYPEEWGYVVRHAGRVSSVRITDVPFVHGRDEHRLLGTTPTLDRIGELLGNLEIRFDVSFERARATVRSNLPRAIPIVRLWLAGAIVALRGDA